MRNHPRDRAQAGTTTDQLQERTQRDQEQRSRQALSNQGSQDRKPASQPDDHDHEVDDKPR
jgi:hypothetical protein